MMDLSTVFVHKSMIERVMLLYLRGLPGLSSFCSGARVKVSRYACK